MATSRAFGAGATLARNASAPLLDSSHQSGLTSLLTQVYNKPVELHLRKLATPQQDVDLLAQSITQKLRDRRATPRRIIRDAAWKSGLPTAAAVTRLLQERQQRAFAEQPLALEELTHAAAPKTSSILRDLNLSMLSSVKVAAAGRLSKRISANRAQGKAARGGASTKGEKHLMRGWQKTSMTYAQRNGKRRIGAYGIKVALGHT